MRQLALLALSSVMTLAVGASICFAGPIEDRQKAMKKNGADIKVLAEIAEGKSPFDAAVVKTNAESIAAVLETVKDMFPQGSESGPPETWAKPETWSDPAGFEAARTAARDAAAALAGVTDQAQYGEALGKLGNGCKNCHEKFRRPKT